MIKCKLLKTYPGDSYCTENQEQEIIRSTQWEELKNDDFDMLSEYIKRFNQNCNWKSEFRYLLIAEENMSHHNIEIIFADVMQEAKKDKIKHDKQIEQNKSSAAKRAATKKKNQEKKDRAQYDKLKKQFEH